MIYTAVFLLVLPCLLNGQLIEVCDPDNFINGRPTTPPLPSVVPSQLSATVEGNLLGRSTSTVVTEYYDQVGDRGRIDFSFNGTNTIGIFDYTQGEVFLIPDPQGGDCRVYEISPQNPFLAMSFGFTEVNGSLHIGSPTAFLERILGRNATVFLGEDTVRGIPVSHWQACVALPNNTYLLDYYFASQSNWTFSHQMDPSIMIPIQFTLNASFVSRQGIDNAYNIYTFLNFKSGPDSVPDEVFDVPTGLACKGRIPGRPLPTFLDNSFSNRIELQTNFQGSPVLVSLQEYYDFQRNLFRLDFYSREGPTTLVHDFNQGVQFKINQNTNKCEVTQLSNLTGRAMLDFDINSGSPSIASPNQLALLNNFFNYSYEGVTTVRGIEVDSWISVRDFEQLPGNVNISNAVYEVFFTRPGLTIVNEHSVTTNSSAIVRIKLSGDFTTVFNNSYITTPLSLQYDMFDYSAEQPPYDAYDVSTCYAHDDSVSIVFVIPVPLVGFSVGALKENIREGISQFTGISPLQVATVSILGDNGTSTFVHVHIANQTSYSTVPLEERVTAATALKLLQDGTTADIASPFTIVVPPNITVTPSIHAHGSGSNVPNNNSCDDMPTPEAPVCPTDDSGDIQKLLQLKDREIVGIAIGLLFGGLIIGALLMLFIVCICRCICKGGSGSYPMRSGVQYKKQDDDIAFPT